MLVWACEKWGQECKHRNMQHLRELVEFSIDARWQKHSAKRIGIGITGLTPLQVLVYE